MLQLPSKIDKESEAKKGIIKLMLLLICYDIDNESTTVLNISLGPPSKGMQVVLNQSRAAQASQFADLVRMTLKFAKQQDYTNRGGTHKIVKNILLTFLIFELGDPKIYMSIR